MGTCLRNKLTAFCPDWKSLGFYIVLLGLAFCRAWIVLCLSAAAVTTLVTNSNWAFLLAGSTAAAGVAVAARRAATQDRFEARMRGLTGALTVSCAVATPIALACGQPIALAALVVVGGAASSFLQVLWGNEYARRPVPFALACYPATAVVIALLIALVIGERGFLAFFVFPIMSFVLLLVETSRIDKEQSLDGVSVEPARQPERDRPALSRKSIAQLMVSIGVFSFLCRVFDSLPGEGVVDPFVVFGGSSVFALAVVGVLFLLFAFLCGDRFEPVFAYRLSLPLMALGMAIVSLFFYDHWVRAVRYRNVDTVRRSGEAARGCLRTLSGVRVGGGRNIVRHGLGLSRGKRDSRASAGRRRADVHGWHSMRHRVGGDGVPRYTGRDDRSSSWPARAPSRWRAQRGRYGGARGVLIEDLACFFIGKALRGDSGRAASDASRE